jgi:diaphanous 1
VPYLLKTAVETPFRLNLAVSPAWCARVGSVAKAFSSNTQRPSIAGHPTSREQGWRPSSVLGAIWKATASTTSSEERLEKVAGEGASTITASKPAAPSRLSSLFDGWLGDAPSTIATIGRSYPEPPDRTVSEPVQLPDTEKDVPYETLPSQQDLDDAFELLMDDLGIKEAHRSAMRQMNSSRKVYLIDQQKRSSCAGPLKSHHTGSSVVSTPDPAAADSRRYSLASSSLSAETLSITSNALTGTTPASSSAESLSISPATSAASSSWMSWFPGGLSQSAAAGQPRDSPSFYVRQLGSSKMSPNALAKQLIALRVCLSTAKLSWITEFLGEAKGLDSLESLISKTVRSR